MNLNGAALRRSVLVTGLLATVAAAVFAPDKDDAPGSAGRPGVAARGQAGATAAVPRLDQGGSRDGGRPVLADFRRQLARQVEVVDLFDARNAPPPPAKPVSKPEPPRLPFAYVGRLQDAGVQKVVLMQAGQVHVVGAGEQLAGGAYRLDQIESDKLVFNYLPMAVTQALPTGDAK